MKKIIVLLFLYSCAAQAQSGVAPSQSGIVNGQPVTLLPHNCGYVNEVYTCTSDTTNSDVVPTPTPSQTQTQPLNALSSFSQWLINVLLWVPLKLFAMLLDGLASIFEAIPVPDWVSTAQAGLSALSPIGYYLNLFAVPQGFATIISAYILRFLIRRIPFVG